MRGVLHGLALASLLWLGILIILLGAACGREPVEEPVGVVLAETPAPTATAAPTQTPHVIVVTATPIPTMQIATPAPVPPTETSRPDMRDEADYLDFVEAFVDTTQGSIQEFVRLLDDPQPFNPSWVERVHVETEMWEELYAVVRDVEPPAGYETFHRHLVSGMEYLASSAPDIRAGIDTLDAARLDQATGKMQRGIEEIEQAALEMDRMR